MAQTRDSSNRLVWTIFGPVHATYLVFTWPCVKVRSVEYSLPGNFRQSFALNVHKLTLSVIAKNKFSEGGGLGGGGGYPL